MDPEMLSQDDLEDLRKQISKASDEASLNVSKTLELLDFIKNKNASQQAIKNSKFGLFLRELSSHKDPQIKRKGKEVLLNWKNYQEQLVKQQKDIKQTTSSLSTKEPSLPQLIKQQTQQQNNQLPKSISAPTTTMSSGPIQIQKSNILNSQSPPITVTPLPIPLNSPSPQNLSNQRQITRKKLQEKMLTHITGKDEVLTSLADEIEEGMYQLVGPEPIDRKTHQEWSDLYRNQYMMLARHITQTKETCDHLMDGSINPRALGMSSAEDLQSENMRKQNEDYIKHSVYWATRKMEAIESSSFKCGKCRKNQCMYTQAQTRSADEPMTTFVFCVNCGHRWKF